MIRYVNSNPYFGITIGERIYAETERIINPVVKPETVIVYTPATPPTVGQAWPRGNV